MGKRIVDKIDTKAFAKDWDKLNYNELSFKYGISRSAVAGLRYLLKLPIKTSQKYSDKDRAKIEAAYNKGGVAEVERQFKVCKCTAYNWLRKLGVVGKPDGYARKVKSSEEFAKDYNAMSLDQLMHKYKSYPVVAYWRRKLNLPYKQHRVVDIPRGKFLTEFRSMGLAGMSRKYTVPIQHLCYWRDKYLMEEKNERSS